MRTVSGWVVAGTFLLAGSAHADKFCFIVAGDGRSDPKTHRPEDKDGVNTLITGEICKAVLKEKAKFLMWTGDLVYGYEKANPKAFETQLLSWRSIMQPLYDKHIPVLPCRGNHDSSSAEADATWNKVFSGKYALPQNGPASEINRTFYHIQGPVLAIGLDQYIQKGEAVNQPWLDGVLAKHKKPFVFSMGHEPAFMDGRHKDNMDASPDKRDAFWESFIKAGARTFFCGHDHFYDHMKVVKANGVPGPEMHQFTAGTAGAPFYEEGEYSGNNTGWKVENVKHVDHTYGYLLVEIDGTKATVTFKGRTSPGNYAPMDSFSYDTKSSKR